MIGRHTWFSIQAMSAFVCCYGPFMAGQRCGGILTGGYHLGASPPGGSHLLDPLHGLILETRHAYIHAFLVVSLHQVSLKFCMILTGRED